MSRTRKKGNTQKKRRNFPQFTQSLSGKPAIVIRDMQGAPRMSEVISHLAKPVIELLGDDVESIEESVRLTILVWNLMLMPEETQKRELVNAKAKLCGLDVEMHALIQKVFDLIQQGKNRHYADIRRFIVDVKFTRESECDVYFEVMHEAI